MKRKQSLSIAAISILIFGFIFSFGSDLFSQVVNAAEPPRVRIAHLAPFTSDEADSAVEVFFDHTLVAGDVTFLQSTKYFSWHGNHVTMEVYLSSDHSFVASQSLILEEDSDYTILVIGDGINRPIEIIQLEDEGVAISDDEVNLRLGHLAPFAKRLRDTRADVRTDDGDPVLTNVRFGDVTGFGPAAAGNYDLSVTGPDGEPVLFNIAPFDLAAGSEVSAFVVGNGSEQPLYLFAYIDDEFGIVIGAEEETPEPETARLYVAHLAPFAEGEGTSVTVKLNGAAALEAFVYGDSTGYLEVPAGEYLVEILPTGTDVVAISGEVELEAGVDYTAIAIGDGANQDLALLPLGDDNSAPADGTFRLRLGHLAPFADTLEGTKADIRLQDGTVVVDDVLFGQTATLELPAGEYDLKVTTPDGETTLIDPKAG